MDVEPLRLIAGETAGDALKRLADRVQMVQSFAQAEVGEGPSSRSFCLLVGLRLKSVISYTPRAKSADAHADFGEVHVAALTFVTLPADPISASKSRQPAASEARLARIADERDMSSTLGD